LAPSDADPSIGATSSRAAPLVVGGADGAKDFNFVIAKISVTTKITEFHEIWPKFRRNFFID
jgi:hypothetical protein